MDELPCKDMDELPCKAMDELPCEDVLELVGEGREVGDDDVVPQRLAQHNQVLQRETK